MGKNANPMYALVGKTTMSSWNFLTSFSWKRGFLANQLKGLYDQKAPPKEKAKSHSKKYCPTVINEQPLPQQNFTTCKAALPCTELTMTIHQASLKPLNVKPATLKTETSIGPCPHKSTGMQKKCQGTTPSLSAMNDESHIHRALPIQGLPPENKANYPEKANKAHCSTNNIRKKALMEESMAHQSSTKQGPSENQPPMPATTIKPANIPTMPQPPAIILQQVNNCSPFPESRCQ